MSETANMPKPPTPGDISAFLRGFLRALDTELRPAVAKANREYDKEFTK